MLNQNHQPFVLEITVILAEGLKSKASTVFSLQRPLRPFITLSTTPPSSYHRIDGNMQCHEYKTRVADEGCSNPTWGDKFHIPLDTTFFPNRCCIYLHLFTKRRFLGQSQLGWCQIPASDIGLSPVGSVRHLSYRLRNRDGSRSHAVVKLAIKLEPQGAVVAGPAASKFTPPVEESRHTVMGIPLATHPCRERMVAVQKQWETQISGGSKPGTKAVIR